MEPGDEDHPGLEPPGDWEPDPPHSSPLQAGGDPPEPLGELEPPGDEPPGEDPPGEDPPGDEPPGDDPPGDEPPGEEPPGDWLPDPPHSSPLQAGGEPDPEPPVGVAGLLFGPEPPDPEPPFGVGLLGGGPGVPS